MPVPSGADAAHVELVVPASTAFLQLLRLNVAVVAGAVFDVDEIEDLKIAVEELAAQLLSVDGGPGLGVSISLGDEGLAVTGERRWSGRGQLAPADYVRTVLDAVVDRYSLETTADAVRFRFEKRVRAR